MLGRILSRLVFYYLLHSLLLELYGESEWKDKIQESGTETSLQLFIRDHFLGIFSFTGLSPKWKIILAGDNHRADAILVS